MLKKLILLGMCLLLTTVVMASPTNVSLPTTYNSYLRSGFLPTVFENPTLLEIGEDDGTFIVPTSDTLITVNISTLSEISIDTVWTYLNVNNTENGGSGSRAFANNGSFYEYGINYTEARSRTTDLEYSIVLTNFPSGLKIQNLGSDAVANMTSLVNTTGRWSVAFEEATSPSGDDEYSYLNSTASNWDSHIMIEYDCQAPASGVWTIRVVCNKNNDDENVPNLLNLTDSGNLNVTNSLINVTSFGRVILSGESKITLNDGGRLIV